MRFYVFYDAELPYGLLTQSESFCDFMRKMVKEILDIDVELILMGQIGLTKTITMVRMGICGEDYKDVVKCVQENEYCRADNILKLESMGVGGNVIIITKDYPEPLHVTKKRGETIMELTSFAHGLTSSHAKA